MPYGLQNADNNEWHKGVPLSFSLISEVDKGDNQPETGGWQENEVEYVFHLHLSHLAFPALLSKAMAYLRQFLPWKYLF